MDELKPKCVQCNGNNVALIFWGYPANMEWWSQAVKDKKIVPGGCVVGDNDPKWECTDCLHQWGRRDEDEEDEDDEG